MIPTTIRTKLRTSPPLARGGSTRSWWGWWPRWCGLLAHQRNTCGGPERGMVMLAFGGRRRLHLMETVTPLSRAALGLVADRTLPDAVLLKLQLDLGRAMRSESIRREESEEGP